MLALRHNVPHDLQRWSVKSFPKEDILHYELCTVSPATFLFVMTRKNPTLIPSSLSATTGSIINNSSHWRPTVPSYRDLFLEIFVFVKNFSYVSYYRWVRQNKKTIHTRFFSRAKVCVVLFVVITLHYRPSLKKVTHKQLSLKLTGK